MLLLDLKRIGNKIYEIRNRKLLSRAEVAENAGLSDRTYADIERGDTTMRIDTLLKICKALNITPNDIFVINEQEEITEKGIVDALGACTITERETALKLLHVYIDSIR